MESTINSVVSFGSYQSVLKTLYKKGQMPSVKKGLYGDILTKDNVSLEHLKPHSKGGETILSNLALASKRTNNSRGNKPLTDVLNWEMLKEYLDQFNFNIKGKFNGEEYQKMILKTCEELGVTNPSQTVKNVANTAKKHGKKFKRWG